MRPLSLLLLLAIGILAAQQPAGHRLEQGADTTAPDTVDARSNAYIHEDWSYFAERLRNEFLALGEKKYRRGEHQAAVMEYFNFLYHFPEDDLVPLVHYRIGRAYEQLEEFGLARKQFTQVWEDPQADPRVKVVCLRQLARMDYETGLLDTILALPPLNDPYLWVLKGFAALTVENWDRSEPFFRQAHRYYPRRGQAVLDSLVADLQALPSQPSHRRWKRTIWNLLPGGGHVYLGSRGEGLGYMISVGSLALATAAIPELTRYALGSAAVGLYLASFRSAARVMAAKNRALLAGRLDGIRQTSRLDALWSFGHPAIY